MCCSGRKTNATRTQDKEQLDRIHPEPALFKVARENLGGLPKGATPSKAPRPTKMPYPRAALSLLCYPGRTLTHLVSKMTRSCLFFFFTEKKDADCGSSVHVESNHAHPASDVSLYRVAHRTNACFEMDEPVLTRSERWQPPSGQESARGKRGETKLAREARFVVMVTKRVSRRGHQGLPHREGRREVCLLPRRRVPSWCKRVAWVTEGSRGIQSEHQSHNSLTV